MKKHKRLSDVSKKTRDRYYKIKYGRYGRKVSRFISRILLTIRERKRRKFLCDTLNTYKKQAIRSQADDNECVKMLINMGLYFLLAERDIQAVKIDALTHPDEWKRNLSLRIILLTIYEWDMGKVSGKDLKSQLDRATVDPMIQDELFRSLRTIKKAQKRAASLLHLHRNAVIAHRDADALMQMKLIESIDHRNVFEAAESFYSASRQFLDAFPNALLQAGSLKGRVAYMLNKASR